ncbi:MAG: RNB domain-containing ribonuclease, partial [Sphingomonadales bacterium]
MSTKRPKKPAPFPTKAELLEFISSAEGRIGKREIARAFQIRGNDKIRLKKLLRELADQGLLAKDGPKSLRPAGRLPSVTVVRVTGIDRYGDLMAEPQRWEGDEPPPRIFIAESKRRRGRALGQGDRALVRLRPEEDEEGLCYSARIIRVLPAAADTVLGRYEGGEKGGRIIPSDRRVKQDFLVEAGGVGGAKHGTLVLAEIESGRGSRSYGLRRARVTECLGDLGDPRSISLISIHHHGLPMKFDAETLSEAEAAPEASMEGRADLRHVPFVTIDPADARDHDDAVYAEAETAGKNAGGWRIMVAIADVAHYVRPGSALEREALKRGNSCYFPDRVVP